jgi:hypothetical protein
MKCSALGAASLCEVYLNLSEFASSYGIQFAKCINKATYCYFPAAAA